jgi:hypothetical protein
MLIPVSEKRKTLKKYLSRKRPIDRFWSDPARLEIAEGGEGLGRHFACPHGPISAQNNDGRPS